MTRGLERVCFAGLLMFLPTLAFGQASLVGTVRDTSGAVLPGVTVEASSPALIERVRTTQTDGTGQYRIVEMRPGTYTVTFTLSSFGTVKREGIELSGTFVATINAEMHVGTVEETVVVTAESPIVDVQSARRQAVISKEVIDALPSGRTALTVAVLMPGVASRSMDVGGTNTISLDSMSVHGSRAGDQRVMTEGLSTGNADLNGQTGAGVPNMSAVQEVTVDTGGLSGEAATGGLTINLIPREGGNTFVESLFATAVNPSWQSSNYSQALKDAGLRAPTTVKSNYDVNPSFGGPFLKNKLWFYTAGRWMHYENYIGDMFYNLNAGDTTKWTYVADLTRPAFFGAVQRSYTGRLTWQASARNKIAISYDDQYRSWDPRPSLTVAPDAQTPLYWPMQRNIGGSWTAPITSRFLIDVAFLNRGEGFQYRRPPEGDPRLDLIPVLEQSTGILYRSPCCQEGTQPYIHNFSLINNVRAAVSYVTGSHQFKTGLTFRSTDRQGTVYDNHYAMTFRFNNGIPNLITERATPWTRDDANPIDLGLFVQDRWTVRRLTTNAALRLDYFTIGYGEQHLGPAILIPNRDVTYPAVDWVSWKDISPRVGATYDLFGNGKTALRATLGKYVLANSFLGAFGSGSNAIDRSANIVTRSWTDANNNFTPDCDLTNPATQDLRSSGKDFCGVMSNTAFGQTIPTTDVSLDTRWGWGKRAYNWEFSSSLQQQLAPRLSVDVGFFARWYGNFTVTQNRALTPADYDPFTITAPVDPRLPNGGGYVLSSLYNLNPAKVSLVPDNVVTFANNFGQQTEHWNGVDVSANYRPRPGLIFQGGISTGRAVTDNCSVIFNSPQTLYCHNVGAFLSQAKFFGTYTVPKIDVVVGATFQSFPGPAISANFNAPNALVQPSLGRPLSGGAANVTVNLVEPNTLFGERTNQLDLRVGKLARLARARANVNLDIFNALNTGAVQTLNNNYASSGVQLWLQPQTILIARFARISVQFDF